MTKKKEMNTVKLIYLKHVVRLNESERPDKPMRSNKLECNKNNDIDEQKEKPNNCLIHNTTLIIKVFVHFGC